MRAFILVAVLAAAACAPPAPLEAAPQSVFGGSSGFGGGGGGRAPAVLQHIESRLREDALNCSGTLVIPGMRRAITTTSGTYLAIRWQGSATTNAAVTEANFGVSVHVDGIAPEYSAFRHSSITAGGGGFNFLVGGEAQVYVTPGQHIVELRCHTYTADTFDLIVLPYSNQQENGLTLVIEEIAAPEWDYTQIPQVVGTDSILMADWRADQGVTADSNNRVSAWADQSGHSNTLTQSTAGLQPLLVANCQNSKPCIRFSPTRLDALTISLAQTTAQRIILLGNHTHQVNDPQFTQCSGANCTKTYLGQSSGGGVHIDHPAILSGGLRVETASAVTGKHLLEFRWNTSDAISAIRTDLGLTADRTEETGANVNSAGTLTQICGDDGNGIGCDLDVYEIQIWQSDANLTKLSVTDDNYVRDMLNRRWAVYTQPTDLGVP